MLDDSMRKLSLKAVIGAIAHDLAHIVEWKSPGHPIISDREADKIVIERGLEELRPIFEIKGYNSKELQEIMRHFKTK